MTKKTRTIDNPAKTTIPAEHYISDSDVPSLVVDIDLTSLGVGSRFEDIHVIHIEDGTITVVCHPADDHEGWQRLDEVGEW
jgi:hypothetical protein